MVILSPLNMIRVLCSFIGPQNVKTSRGCSTLSPKKAKNENRDTLLRAQEEMNFLRMALQGKCSAEKIDIHALGRGRA